MMTAWVVGPAGDGSHGASAPAASTSVKGVTATPDGSCSFIASTVSWSPVVSSQSAGMIGTTSLRSRIGSFAALASVLNSLPSHTHTAAPVWLPAELTPSSPSVAYAVTTVAPCRQHASRRTIQSRCVSAKMSTFAPGLSPATLTSLAASAAVCFSSSAYVTQSYASAYVSFSNALPLLRLKPRAERVALAVLLERLGHDLPRGRRAVASSAPAPKGARAARRRRARVLLVFGGRRVVQPHAERCASAARPRAGGRDASEEVHRAAGFVQRVSAGSLRVVRSDVYEHRERRSSRSSAAVEGRDPRALVLCSVLAAAAARSPTLVRLAEPPRTASAPPRRRPVRRGARRRRRR